MINIDDLPELLYEGQPSLPPQKDDLERLYKLIKNNFCVTVLEFGCGYSTFVIAKALEENKHDFESLENKPIVRNSNMFKCFSVDTNKRWANEVESKLDSNLVNFFWSYAYATKHEGQLCSYYRSLPDIIPDFIYLDGPDPAQVRDNQTLSIGWVKCKERTPMSGDILLIESTMIPGTFILIDGRTNNARFLKNNLKRDWLISQDGDTTLMYLNEPRLGKVNVIGRDILDTINDAT